MTCHGREARSPGVVHRFADNSPCTPCHGGDAEATALPAAHQDLIAFPGNLDNAGKTCGRCHRAQLTGVLASPMHTGADLVRTTRRLLDPPAGDNPRLQALGHGVADGLLRKLCASCHLGQPKVTRGVDVVHDRGGGCLACHLDAEGPGHPRLTAKVDDGHCFGCHSRSGRIALSYVGLAEVDPSSLGAGARLVRLTDGRLLERRPADVHHQAGMACIDCHTGPGLMGMTPAADGADIACTDCHRNRRERITLTTWPQAHRAMLARLPFRVDATQPFLTTAAGTPLWHIELRNDGSAYLHSKLTNRVLAIPQLPSAHPDGSDHGRLGCAACHAQWAPQCHGCHLRFDPAGEQWDHVERRPTPGRWHERRWAIRNDLPPLGVRADGMIDVAVPGMIMTVDHPHLGEPRFVRRFAAMAPHTIGPARRCIDCHRSAVALGLGEGRLILEPERIGHVPAHAPLVDGLPADAWTTLHAHAHAPTAPAEVRPFSTEEIRRLIAALPLSIAGKAPPD